MKRLLLGILWGYLLFFGVFLTVQAWTTQDIPVWMYVLLMLPLSTWTVWTYFILYEIQMATRPKETPDATFIEAPRVQLKMAGMIYINDQLYQLTEQSHEATFDGSYSRIIMDSVEPGKTMFSNIRLRSTDGPFVTPRDQDPDF